MQDVVFAFRQMRHQWGATAIAIITLGLGLGASLAVFTLVNAVLLRPLPYPESGSPDEPSAAGCPGISAKRVAPRRRFPPRSRALLQRRRRDGAAGRG